MNLDDLAGEAKRENIIAIVHEMSKVDGKLHENELVYLLKLGRSLGLTEEDVRAVILEKNTIIFVPRSEQDRMTILYYLIFLMKIDDEIDDTESELLHHYGLKLGFNNLMIENIIRILKSYIGKELPPDAILDEVKKYLN